MKEKGFTLLELLFTLSLVSLLLVLLVPIQSNFIKKMEEKAFFDLFHSDVLYIQNIAMTTPEVVSIHFEKNYYYIERGIRRLYKRKIPDSITITNNAMEKISFNYLGVIRYPGSILFNNGEEYIEYICPLGKGRCYFG
ncbi:MAG TPA: competence type IV pilus minor pilin ComGD [Bacillota bacterium]|nr:competence type IV pilus minor pilin ComGD [Bacillota bacterium]